MRMMALQLELKELLASIPRGLVDVDLTQSQITPLHGGLGNSIFKLSPAVTDEQTPPSYVLRHHNSQLGDNVNRKQEQWVWQQCAAKNIAPKLIYWCPQDRFSLAEYISPADKPLTSNTDTLIALLTVLHSLPSIPCHRSYSARISSYWKTIEHQRHIDNIAALTSWYAQVDDWIDNLYKSGLAPCLCHHDLNANNLLWNKDRWLAIDFEYADLGHPLFELACLGDSLPPDAADKLWRGYLAARGINADSQQEQNAWSAANKVFAYISLLWGLVERLKTPEPAKSAHAEELDALVRKQYAALQLIAPKPKKNASRKH